MLSQAAEVVTVDAKADLKADAKDVKASDVKTADAKADLKTDVKETKAVSNLSKTADPKKTFKAFVNAILEDDFDTVEVMATHPKTSHVLNEVGENDDHPLSIALENNKVETALFLINLDAVNVNVMMYLHYVIGDGDQSLAVFHALLARKETRLNAVCAVSGDTALLKAASLKNVYCAYRLLDDKRLELQTINRKNKKEETPLYHALKNSHGLLALKLLKKGADPLAPKLVDAAKESDDAKKMEPLIQAFITFKSAKEEKAKGEAATLAGDCYREVKDEETAVEWWQKAIELGDAKAALKLGEIYEKQKVDPVKIVQLYRQNHPKLNAVDQKEVVARLSKIANATSDQKDEKHSAPDRQFKLIRYAAKLALLRVNNTYKKEQLEEIEECYKNLDKEDQRPGDVLFLQAEKLVCGIGTEDKENIRKNSQLQRRDILLEAVKQGSIEAYECISHIIQSSPSKCGKILYEQALLKCVDEKSINAKALAAQIKEANDQLTHSESAPYLTALNATGLRAASLFHALAVKEEKHSIGAYVCFVFEAHAFLDAGTRYSYRALEAFVNAYEHKMTLVYLKRIKHVIVSLFVELQRISEVTCLNSISRLQEHFLKEEKPEFRAEFLELLQTLKNSVDRDTPVYRAINNALATCEVSQKNETKNSDELIRLLEETQAENKTAKSELITRLKQRAAKTSATEKAVADYKRAGELGDAESWIKASELDQETSHIIAYYGYALKIALDQTNFTLAKQIVDQLIQQFGSVLDAQDPCFPAYQKVIHDPGFEKLSMETAINLHCSKQDVDSLIQLTKISDDKTIMHPVIDKWMKQLTGEMIIADVVTPFWDITTSKYLECKTNYINQFVGLYKEAERNAFAKYAVTKLEEKLSKENETRVLAYLYTAKTLHHVAKQPEAKKKDDVDDHDTMDCTRHAIQKIRDERNNEQDVSRMLKRLEEITPQQSARAAQLVKDEKMRQQFQHEYKYKNPSRKKEENIQLLASQHCASAMAYQIVERKRNDVMTVYLCAELLIMAMLGDRLDDYAEDQLAAVQARLKGEQGKKNILFDRNLPNVAAWFNLLIEKLNRHMPTRLCSHLNPTKIILFAMVLEEKNPVHQAIGAMIKAEQPHELERIDKDSPEWKFVESVYKASAAAPHSAKSTVAISPTPENSAPPAVAVASGQPPSAPASYAPATTPGGP